MHVITCYHVINIMFEEIVLVEIIGGESSRQNRINATSESDFNENRQKHGFAVKIDII